MCLLLSSSTHDELSEGSPPIQLLSASASLLPVDQDPGTPIETIAWKRLVSKFAAIQGDSAPSIDSLSGTRGRWVLSRLRLTRPVSVHARLSRIIVQRQQSRKGRRMPSGVHPACRRRAMQRIDADGPTPVHNPPVRLPDRSRPTACQILSML